MNAWDLQRAVMRDRWRRGFVLPNYTPSKWWECDLFELTDGGFFREYEIKLSRGDFFADAKKEKEVLPRPWGEPVVMENKHARLAAGDECGPSQFWFVTPAGLITPEELPPWAGLMEVSFHGNYGRDVERVKAPRIHRVKFKRGAEHSRSVCYWRMHAEFGTQQPISYTVDDPELCLGGGGI